MNQSSGQKASPNPGISVTGLLVGGPAAVMAFVHKNRVLRTAVDWFAGEESERFIKRQPTETAFGPEDRGQSAQYPGSAIVTKPYAVVVNPHTSHRDVSPVPLVSTPASQIIAIPGDRGTATYEGSSVTSQSPAAAQSTDTSGLMTASVTAPKIKLPQLTRPISVAKQIDQKPVGEPGTPQSLVAQFQLQQIRQALRPVPTQPRVVAMPVLAAAGPVGRVGK